MYINTTGITKNCEKGNMHSKHKIEILVLKRKSRRQFLLILFLTKTKKMCKYIAKTVVYSLNLSILRITFHMVWLVQRHARSLNYFILYLKKKRMLSVRS